MQPQANRERIIIRTSLAHMLPPVVADARALRQITLNLIGNSIHLANAGGQVIVSTALSDFGEVVLRVRDTGHGLNDNEVAAALQPFRTPAPSDRVREFGRQPVADQSAGRSQPRQIPDQDRRPFRHADRDRVSARGGAGLTSPASPETMPLQLPDPAIVSDPAGASRIVEFNPGKRVWPGRNMMTTPTVLLDSGGFSG